LTASQRDHGKSRMNWNRVQSIADGTACAVAPLALLGGTFGLWAVPFEQEHLLTAIVVALLGVTVNCVALSIIAARRSR
jgi:hypothetical protein